MGTLKTCRKMGDILLDLEPILFELTEEHEMQLGELLALIKCWTEIHSPGSIEEYQDDTHPVYYYGPRENMLAFAKKLR